MRGAGQGSCSCSSPFAAPDVQACTCHHQGGTKCGQHGRRRSSSSSKAGQKLKAKLKSAMQFMARGLSWSTHAPPAFPVPVYYPTIIA
jgi:hypothetical protein